MRNYVSRIMVVLAVCVLVTPVVAQEPRDPGCKQWDRVSLPDWFGSWWEHSQLRNTYDFACYMNPFWQVANFDGRQPSDLAVLVVAKETQKRGVLILHRPSLESHVLAAGVPIANFGPAFQDDFRYVWGWQVQSASSIARLVTRERMPRFRGDILYLQHEGPGTWIGWNGSEYVGVVASGN